MKKTLKATAVLLAVLVLLPCLFACTAQQQTTDEITENKTEQITESVELQGEPVLEQGEVVPDTVTDIPLAGLIEQPLEGDVVYYPSPDELEGLSRDEIWEQIRWMDRQSMRDRWNLIASEDAGADEPFDEYALGDTRALRVSFDESGVPTDVTVIDLTGKS